MKLIRVLFLTLLLQVTISLSSQSNAHAVLLASYDVIIGSSGTATEIDWDIFYTDTFGGTEIPGTRLFDSLTFTPSTPAGALFTVTVGDPGFDLFTALMTNGAEDFLAAVSSAVPGGPFAVTTGLEYFLGTLPSPFLSNNGIDLQGYTITSYNFLVNQIDTFGGGLFVNGAFQVNGQPIPEPTTWLMLGLGLSGVMLWRKNKSLIKRPS